MPVSPEFRNRQYLDAAKTVERIEELLKLEFPIQLTLATLRQIHSRQFALDNATCTGTVHWRDSKDSTAKMIIVHRQGTSCPLHGKPKTRKARIRSYVGTNPKRQAAAQAAIDALPEQARLERAAAQCKSLIWRTHSTLLQVRERLDQMQEIQNNRTGTSQERESQHEHQ